MRWLTGTLTAASRTLATHLSSSQQPSAVKTLKQRPLLAQPLMRAYGEAKDSADWNVWTATFGGGLRKTLLAYRDGARMVAGSRLRNTEYMKTAERIGARLLEEGFTVRQAAILLSTIYNYTLSFVMEEQAVFPRPNERSPQYDIAARNEKLDPKEFPILRQSGPILFDKFDRRYKEGLDLILRGAREKKRQG